MGSAFAPPVRPLALAILVSVAFAAAKSPTAAEWYGDSDMNGIIKSSTASGMVDSCRSSLQV